MRCPRPVEQAEAAPSAAAQALVASYRLHGYRCAAIDPLGVALRDPRRSTSSIRDASGCIATTRRSSRSISPDRPQTFSIPQLIAALQEATAARWRWTADIVRSREQCAWLHAQMEQRMDAGLRRCRASRSHARAARRGRGLRALPARRLPAPQAVQSRRLREPRAADGDADRGVGRAWRRGRRRRHGASRAAESADQRVRTDAATAAVVVLRSTRIRRSPPGI